MKWLNRKPLEVINISKTTNVQASGDGGYRGGGDMSAIEKLT